MVTRIGPKRLPLRRIFIREWREHRHLSQQRLADRLETSKATISRWENLKREPGLGELAAIANALQCEIADLLSRDPSEGEGLWQLWNAMGASQREQALRLLRAFSGHEAA